MMPAMEIDYVTSNLKKFEEAYHILKAGENANSLSIVHANVHLTEIQGTAEEIAIHKAKEAYSILKKPVIIDDISLYCHALNGMPGPYIRYFLETIGDEGIYKLISHYSCRRVDAVCSIAFYDGIESPRVFQGSVSGSIVAPHGSKTLHGKVSWNTIVQLDGCESTLADMPLEEYALVSPRNQALQLLKQHLHSLKASA